MYCLRVYMCAVLLPPAGYPIAVNKYVISYLVLWNETYFVTDTLVSWHASATLTEVFPCFFLGFKANATV